MADVRTQNPVKIVDPTTDANQAGVTAGGNLQVVVNAALPAGSANIGDVDVLTVPAPLSTTGTGTEATALRVTLATDSTGLVSVDDNGGALTVDNGGTFAVQADTELPAAAALGDDVANPTAPAVGAFLMAFDEAGNWDRPRLTVTPADATTNTGVRGLSTASHQMIFNGTSWDRIRGDITNGIDVDVTRLPALVAGSANIGDVDVLTMPNVTLAAGTNTNEVVGDVAHDVAAAGNPLLAAGISQDSDDTAPPNRVNAEADATRLATDRDGSLHVLPYGPQIWSYHDDDVAAVTTDGTVHAAPGAGLSLYVGSLVFSIGAATASSIFLEESTTKVLGPYYLEAIAGRGLVIQFNPPKKITANTALLVTNTGAISFSVDITGFTAQG